MSPCKQCGLPVHWTKIGRRWHCHNADGTDHWDRCSQARTARIRRTGVPFERTISGTHETGYKTPLKKSGELLMSIAVPPKGKARTADCRECVPPWERCDGCPIQFRAAA